jgi:KDO2-lipid IV(A) lauroyltransferase
MKRKVWRWRLEYLLCRLVVALLGRLPRHLALRAGAAIGRLAHRLLPSRRRVALANLALALPELPGAQREQIAADSFRRLGMLLAEFAQFPRLTPAKVLQVARPVGHQHYLKAKSQGKGVIFLTAHFGAWELLSFAQALLGHPLKFVVRQLDNPLLDRVLTAYRTRCGNGVIERREAARGILRALAAGEAVGILFDQNTSDGVVVPFFGLPTRTTPVVATLALRTGAPVIPVFLAASGDGYTHSMIFEPEVELQRSGNLKRDIEVNTTRFNQILEGHIRQHPDHWLWLHKRWKDSPITAATPNRPPAA